MDKKTKTLILMVIALLLGYLPWYNFSAVVGFIAEDFTLSSSQTGMILSVFQLGYVVVVLITGWLADKIGTKKVVSWATLFTAIFSTLFAFLAKDFTSIMILRLLTGLSAGAIYAPGMALLSNWFAPEERGKALGAYTAGLVAASAGGYFVAAPLAAAYSWQVGILATSLPVFIAAIIMFFFIEERPSDESLSYDGAPGIAVGQPAPAGGFKGPVLLTGSYMGHMWELYAFWGWIGPFMVACAVAVGKTVTEAVSLGGLLAALIILIGAPAVYLLGIAADKYGRTKTIMVAATCSLVPQFFFGYMYGMSLPLVVAIGVWIGFWVIADSAIYKAGLTEMTEDRVRTTILSIQSAVGYSMTILAPMAFGWLLQYLNPGVETTMATNWGLCFVMLGVGALFAPILAYFTRKVPQAKLMTGGKM
ncbi:MAG TPA: MFS transporter [Syntrophomonadaceae bacterium]|nr:MFS transporter [Syntrophomonadaceae bacterium]